MRSEDLPQIGIQSVDQIVSGFATLDGVGPQCGPGLLHRELVTIETHRDHEQPGPAPVGESLHNMVEFFTVQRIEDLILLLSLPRGVDLVTSLT